MTHASIGEFISIVAATVVIAASFAVARPARVSMSARKITLALTGKTCSTRAGAKFTFGRNGRYAYNGLWTSNGRYWVNNDSISVLLDNGLERDFAISTKGGILYMEQTALFCK